MPSITRDLNAHYEDEADLARLADAAERRSRFVPDDLTVIERFAIRETHSGLKREEAFWMEPNASLPCRVKTRSGEYRIDNAQRSTSGLVRVQYSRRS